MYNTGPEGEPWRENPYRGSNPFLKKNRFIIYLMPLNIPGTCGRDGFYIHGKGRGDGVGASKGCIILEPEWRRESMYRSGDRDLLVMAHDPFLYPELGHEHNNTEGDT